MTTSQAVEINVPADPGWARCSPSTLELAILKSGPEISYRRLLLYRTLVGRYGPLERGAVLDCLMSEALDTDAPSLFVIGPRGDRAPLVETLLSMLQNARRYLLTASRDLTAAQLDAVPAGVPNGVGAILSHLSAAERMFQNLLFRGYTFSDEQRNTLEPTFRFMDNPLAGSGIEAYHAQLAEVRAETLALLGGVDDDWLASEMTFAGRVSNRHYYWLHYLQDEARHTGQIILIRKHLLPDPEPDFDAYALR